MSSNPFTRDFGREPKLMINRDVPFQMIFDSFTDEMPSSHIFLVTGVRGTGKTVLMTSVANELKERDEWMVISLNVLSDDLMLSFAEHLGRNLSFGTIFKRAKIDLSFLQLELEAKQDKSQTEVQIKTEKMLKALKDEGKRVLVAIDEVENTESMQRFASTFQILIRDELPVFLLMTGLYDKVHALQNEKSLTFLLRAPTIALTPLSKRAIASKYLSVLHIGYKEAREMAEITKGYSFAFQILGYYTYLHNGNYRAALEEFWVELADHIYDKLWEEMSPADRKFALAIARSPSGRISEVMEIAGWDNRQISPYRQRLIKKGIAVSSKRGEIEFVLPMFERFVLESESDFSEIDENLCPQCGSLLPPNANFCPRCGQEVKRSMQ